MRVVTQVNHVSYRSGIAPAIGERDRIKVVRLERRGDDGQYRSV